MANVNELVEQTDLADSEEQTGGDTSTHEDTDVVSDEPEAVQEGNLNEPDRQKLVEDLNARAGTDIGSSKPSTPAPRPPEQLGDKPSTPAPRPLGDKPSTPAPRPLGDKPSTPAPKPPDQYELLKKGISSLTEGEKEERKKLIREKYVDNWKKKKEEERENLTKDLADDEKSKEETRETFSVPEKSKAEKLLENLDDAKEVVDLGVDVTDAGFSLGTDIADAAYSRAGKKEHKATSRTGNIAGIATGTLGTLSSGYSLFRSGQQAREKSKKGDSRGARLSRFDVAGSLFGTLSGASGVAGNIAGLAGKDDASDWLGQASGIAGLAGSLTGLAKGSYQFGSYRRLAGRKGTETGKKRLSQQHTDSKKRYKEMKDAYRGGEAGTTSKENRMEMLKQRHNRKRSQDFMEAMASAQEHAKIKSRAGIGGIISGALASVGGGVGLAGSFAKQFGGVGGKIAGAVLGGIGSLLNLSTKGVDFAAGRKEKAAGKAAGTAKGKAYIEKKVASLLKKSDAQADQITDNEAQHIVAERLGIVVDPPDYDKPPDYAEVYKKLSERRADRILNREEGYEEVLASMGLTKDADKAAILEALGVS